jgi:transposase
MYLKKTPQRTGRLHLAIAESYREDGKNKTRTVKSLGYLDEFTDIHEDPIAYFSALAKEMTQAEQERNAPFQITIHPLQKINRRTENRKNIGSAVCLNHYNLLGIEKVIRNAIRNRKFEFDLNSVMRLLVVERILHPGSKLKALKGASGYFFESDFTDDDMYSALDVFSVIKDKIVSSANRQIAKVGKRDLTAVLYDVTNYHFETEIEDDLRRRGVAKNQRRDPIIQMGLLLDSNSIPINYKTFAGNTSDSKTLIPVLLDLKRDYGLADITLVADKGLNCSDNIAAITLGGADFIFSQSIRGTKSDQRVRDWVISESGYQANSDNTFKIKSRQDIKNITVTGDDGKRKKVGIEIKMVAFWSSKYARRSKRKRDETLAKAKMLISNPSQYTKATSYGAAQYIKNISFDKKTGEIIEGTGQTLKLDYEAIAKAQECDGYYCLITSKLSMADSKIIDAYRELFRIEEMFKVSKSDIETRPLYVWTPEHIEAHFLTCYIALTILSLIRYDTDFKYTSSQIIEELQAMSGSREESNWWLFDHRTDISDELCKSVGIDLSRKRMKTGEIKQVLTEVNGKKKD